MITEPRHEALLAPIADRLPPILSSTRFADPDDPAPVSATRSPTRWRPTHDAADPGLEPDVDSIWALIFTSGTSDAPKAVICSQRRLLVTGKRMAMIMDLGPDDVGYVCMPLFHSNAVQVGWAPSIVTPCAVGLGRRFSASRWLGRHPPLRRRPTSTTPASRWPTSSRSPSSADDADNPLRVAFGNEGSPEVVGSFSRRFGVEVIDAYGATEGGVAVNRGVDMPAGALGLAPDHVQVVDDDGKEKVRADLDDHGRVRNAEECVGEIVNTQGVGPVRGLLQQRRRDREDDALRLVLVGRPRLQGRARASSTSRAATPTGSESTARTSRPARSRRRCARRRASCSPRSTASPTTRPATR